MLILFSIKLVRPKSNWDLEKTSAFLLRNSRDTNCSCSDKASHRQSNMGSKWANDPTVFFNSSVGASSPETTSTETPSTISSTGSAFPMKAPFVATRFSVGRFTTLRVGRNSSPPSTELATRTVSFIALGLTAHDPTSVRKSGQITITETRHCLCCPWGICTSSRAYIVPNTPALGRVSSCSTQPSSFMWWLQLSVGARRTNQSSNPKSYQLLWSEAAHWCRNSYTR